MHTVSRSSLSSLIRWGLTLLLAGFLALPLPGLAQEATPVLDEAASTPGAPDVSAPDVAVSATDYFQQGSRQVTFAIVVSGDAPGGTTIDLTSQFDSGLTLLGVEVGGGMPETNASATWLSSNSTSSSYAFQIAVTNDGTYSAQMDVLTNANTDVPPDRP